MKSWPAKALLLAGRRGAARASRRSARTDARIAAAAGLRRSRRRCRRPREGDAAAAQPPRSSRRRRPRPARPAPSGDDRQRESERRRGGRARTRRAAAADQLFHRFPKAARARSTMVGPLEPGNFGLGARRVRPRRRRPARAALMRAARRALAVALDLDPAPPRLAVARSPRRRASQPVDWVAERAGLAAADGRGRCGADAGPGGRRRELYAADDRGGGADRARHRRSGRALPAGRAGAEPVERRRSGCSPTACAPRSRARRRGPAR